LKDILTVVINKCYNNYKNIIESEVVIVSDKIAISKETHEFAEKLVDSLYNKGLITDKANIPDEMINTIIDAVRTEAKRKH